MCECSVRALTLGLRLFLTRCGCELLPPVFQDARGVVNSFLLDQNLQILRFFLEVHQIRAELLPARRFHLLKPRLCPRSTQTRPCCCW